MRLIEKAFHIAMKELGQTEIVGKADNPRIIEYLKAVDINDEITLHDEIAWCSAFVNWCIQQAGGKGTRQAAARSWLNWGKSVEKPEVGDIVIFRRPPSKWMGHVGFVYEVGPLGYKVLGGNQSNQVCLKNYSSSKVLGFRTSKD